MLEKRILLFSGVPRIGKTKLLVDILRSLKRKGYTIGGMISREIRSGGVRVGFEVLDFADQDSGWLAHISEKTGPRVGKYRVNIENLDRIGVKAIRNALQNTKVIVIDEIGPMELFSKQFRDVVKDAFTSTKLVMGVVHQKVVDKLAAEARNRRDAEIFVVTQDNKEHLFKTVTKMAIRYLSVLE